MNKRSLVLSGRIREELSNLHEDLQNELECFISFLEEYNKLP